MARLFPYPPVGSITPGQARFSLALRSIPGDQTLAWMALPLGKQDRGWRPDWMILHEKRVCFLVAISEITLQQDLFADAGKPASTPESEALNLQSRMREFIQLAQAANRARTVQIYGAILFPHLANEALQKIQTRLPGLDVALWGSEAIDPDSILQALQETGGPDPLPASVIDDLRRKISPEIIIPARLTARPKTFRPLQSTRPARAVLDLDQEFLSKENLQIPEELEILTASDKTRIIHGVAGSGKSLVLLYRAALYEKIHADSRVLCLTHNRPLVNELQARQERISPATKLRWETFFGFCGKLSSKRTTTLAFWEKENLLTEIAASIPALAPFRSGFLIEEIDWIRDQGFFSDEDYLSAPRYGRRRPLQQPQRQAILELLAAYRERLRATNQTDWHDIPEQLWRGISSGAFRPPVYDQVFIDEAQFFAPVWFRIIHACLDSARGRVFLAADPTQGFLKRRHSWQALGIQARGNIARLKKSHRNCREILEFATEFYLRRLPGEDEEISLPDTADLNALPPGEGPDFLFAPHIQDEQNLVANDILDDLKTGAHPGNYLVLFNNKLAVEGFVALLNQRHGSPIAADAKENDPSSADRVRVTTLNAATGLESTVVYLCGLDALLEKEDEIGLDDDERSELVRDNTRQIYMAITRAGRRIHIVCRSERTQEILTGQIAWG